MVNDCTLARDAGADGARGRAGRGTRSGVARPGSPAGAGSGRDTRRAERSGPAGPTLDAADELGNLRRQFELPRERGRTLTYLCGHSLGLMPRAARRVVDKELERWATHAVDGHFPDERHGGWLDYHTQFAAPLAALVGAQRGEVVAMNTLTVNLHLMLATFFRPSSKRYKILIERDAFSSDRYAVESQLRWHGLDPKDALLEIGPRDGGFELDTDRYYTQLKTEGERIALVLLPGVQYLSGERLDLVRGHL